MKSEDRDLSRRPTVALVRHGQTDWSKSGRHTGRTDVPLTETGRDQARLLGELLVDWQEARVFTSPLAARWKPAALLASTARTRSSMT